MCLVSCILISLLEEGADDNAAARLEQLRASNRYPMGLQTGGRRAFRSLDEEEEGSSDLQINTVF